MAKSNYRLYCAVLGCLNSSITHPKITFFKLPGNAERRLEWLQLICRNDLENKPNFAAYRICETHFNVEDIRQSSNRKLLKNNALPLLMLPSLPSTVPGSYRKEDKQTQTALLTVVENGTQTENAANESYAQTSTSLSSNTPRKRKLKPEILQCRKKIKLQETENKTQKAEESTFHQLCDKFLNNKLVLLIKAQSTLKQHGKGYRYDQDYITYCLNLYYIGPQAYRFLQSALCLPCPSTLYKRSFPITTEINEKAMSVLKMKVAQMTEVEKNCSVMIGATSLKTNLFFNIKEDKINGFHEIEGLQSPEPAKNALVIMIRGILVNWKQPVAYALISECRNYDVINKWIDKVLQKLFEIGLIIRIFVSDQGSDLWKASKKRIVSVETPYFFINNSKIYCTFDAPHLIKNVRNVFMKYDFHFGNSIAKYDHIIQFYNHDKEKSFRLAPKLTNSHIKPTNYEKMKVCFATQLFSRSVAIGMCTYIDNNEIEESGSDTANFLLMMNDLFDSLNTSNLRHSYEYKRAYRGDESQKAFFKNMISFFQELKLINPKNGRDHTSSVRFIEGFQITITSLMLLFDDLRVEGYNFLMTRRCNQDALENLFRHIRTKNGMALKPTCRQFASAFKNLFFCNIMKPPKGGNCAEDFGKLLVQTTCEEVNSCVIPVPTNEISNKDNEEFRSVQITSSDYNQLDMPEKNSLFYICGYLLKRCLEKHDDCQALKSYVKPHQRSHNFSAETQCLRYWAYSKNNSQTLLIVPSDDFIEYVEKMEEIFRTSFETKHIINCKVAAESNKFF
ncbi:unnamed protein product, partial [Brenthis ino]